MRTIFKQASTLGAIALAAATLTATSVMAEDLTLWTLNFDNNAANVALKKVATDFEAANPGTHVEIVQRGIDEHKTALRVAAGSNRGPDIYFSWAGLGLGGEYVKAGLSLPLELLEPGADRHRARHLLLDLLLDHLAQLDHAFHRQERQRDDRRDQSHRITLPASA